ncbi:hypothetical protein D3C84_560230 [compost metagenome]
MAAQVSAITANSARLTRHSARRPGTSTSPRQISRITAAIAGSGTCASSAAPNRVNSATHNAENTPASGDSAPDCWLSAERVNEPADR